MYRVRKDKNEGYRVYLQTYLEMYRPLKHPYVFDVIENDYVFVQAWSEKEALIKALELGI